MQQLCLPIRLTHTPTSSSVLISVAGARPRFAELKGDALFSTGRHWNESTDGDREFPPIIHLVFADLKTWLIGIHHGASAQHLQAYLNEFTFRFNRRFYPFNAFRSLLGIAGGVRAPTYDELYSGDWEHPTCSSCACLSG